MFDKAEIKVKAGNGGSGAISFRHEKFVPFGGPDGGDGGGGGGVILMADASINDLLSFVRKRAYRARNGGNGTGKKKHGKRGEDLVLKVPVGTVVWETNGERKIIADLDKDGQQVVVANGGRGGLGNVHYTTSTNQAPRIAQAGESGEEKSLLLELRLIADVGIIGLPNAGKSTLLAAASAAKPKIASYPFTTLEPIRGVVEIANRRLILAEIPGLIEGAHLGKGLGHDFLRHAMRTRMFIHLVDGISAKPVKEMEQVNNELALFDPSVGEKPQLVAINKVDLPEVRARIKGINDAFGKDSIRVLFVSAETGEGVDGLLAETARMLDSIEAKELLPAEEQLKVFHPQPRRVGFEIKKEEDVFIVSAPELERIIARVELNDPIVRGQIRDQFNKMHITQALVKAGVKPGNKVHCGNLELEW